MSKKEKALSEEKEWERVDEAVMGSGRFLAKYQKQLLIGLGVIAVIVCGYFAYQNFYQKPKTEEAQIALYKGQLYFMDGKDSVALYGNGNDYFGFDAVIDEYGSTEPGNLAKAYAGLIYKKQGDYEKALSYLKSYDGSDKIFQYLVKGAIGDCLSNTGKTEEAIPFYQDAAKNLDDELYSPLFYKKAALAYRSLGQYDKVSEIFTTIKNRYANSMESMEADKYIDEAKIAKQ